MKYFHDYNTIFFSASNQITYRAKIAMFDDKKNNFDKNIPLFILLHY